MRLKKAWKIFTDNRDYPYGQKPVFDKIPTTDIRDADLFKENFRRIAGRFHIHMGIGSAMYFIGLYLGLGMQDPQNALTGIPLAFGLMYSSIALVASAFYLPLRVSGAIGGAPSHLSYDKYTGLPPEGMKRLRRNAVTKRDGETQEPTRVSELLSNINTIKSVARDVIRLAIDDPQIPIEDIAKTCALLELPERKKGKEARYPTNMKTIAIALAFLDLRQQQLAQDGKLTEEDARSLATAREWLMQKQQDLGREQENVLAIRSSVIH